MDLELINTQKERLCQQEIHDAARRLPYCEHYHLMAKLDEKQRVNVVHHVADVAFRSEKLGKKPRPLTFDDVLCVAIALEMRRIDARKTGKHRIALLSYLDLPIEEIDRIAARGARYLAGLLVDHEEYNTEPKLRLARRLMPFLTPSVLKEQLVIRGPRSRNLHLGDRVRSQGHLDYRYSAAKTRDNKGLAVFTLGASVEDTIYHGIACYKDTREVTTSEWGHQY